MSRHELDRFLTTWNFEAKRTADLLRALPTQQYDFRPDPKGRSLGEMAWHLAEIDAYMTSGIEQNKFDFTGKPAGIERPRAIQELAGGYERIHSDAVARVQKLTPEDLDREVVFFNGQPTKVRDILWGAILHHLIHHRGQLAMMCRLSGGTPPGVYGPNREEMEAMRATRS